MDDISDFADEVAPFSQQLKASNFTFQGGQQRCETTNQPQPLGHCRTGETLLLCDFIAKLPVLHLHCPP